MAFYLVNVPVTFHSYINKCLVEKLDIFCIINLDNILIYSNKKKAKHEEAVGWVLDQLRKFSLYANLKKCWFNTDKLHFVRYIVSFLGAYIESECIESIKNLPEP